MDMKMIKFRVFDSISKKMYGWEVVQGIPLVDFNKEHYTLMQYIGLSDKNGVEIYEGDIVKGFGAFKDVVRFENAYFSWDHSPITIDLSDFDEIDEIKDTTQWAKVIGNIYENPELL